MKSENGYTSAKGLGLSRFLGVFFVKQEIPRVGNEPASRKNRYCELTA